MTVVSVASFLQAASHPAHGDRRLTMSMFGGRGGVIPRTATFTDLKVTQRGAGANMSVDVADGSCLVTGTEATYQGVYHGENQGTLNVPITAADATNARRTLIVARIKDSEYGVAVTDAFSIEAVDGAPAASPADPTVPSNCIVLARVAVAAAASSITNANITDLRNGYAAVTGSSAIGNQVKAAGLGGVVVCTSSFRPTVGLYQGLVIYETDTGLTQVYTGSGWTWLGARGLIGYGASGSDQTAITTTPLDLTGVTTAAMTIPTGRNIRIEAHVGIYKGGSDATGWGQLYIKNGATTLASTNAYIAIGTFSFAYLSVVLRGTLSGTVTIKAQLATNTSFINTNSGSYIAAYDMGPT